MGFTSRKRSGSRRRVVLCAGILAVAPILGLAAVQDQRACDDPAIQYATTAPSDAIDRLQKRIERGEVKLQFVPGHGYLDSVLKALNISPKSQMLVFSKTSFQRDLISPESPRALYFNQDAYIGFVQGGRVLEVASVDPKLGAVFYLLPQTQAATPKFV